MSPPLRLHEITQEHLDKIPYQNEVKTNTYGGKFVWAGLPNNKLTFQMGTIDGDDFAVAPFGIFEPKPGPDGKISESSGFRKALCLALTPEEKAALDLIEAHHKKIAKEKWPTWFPSQKNLPGDKIENKFASAFHQNPEKPEYNGTIKLKVVTTGKSPTEVIIRARKRDAAEDDTSEDAYEYYEGRLTDLDKQAKVVVMAELQQIQFPSNNFSALYGITKLLIQKDNKRKADQNFNFASGKKIKILRRPADADEPVLEEKVQEPVVDAPAEPSTSSGWDE